MSDDECLGCHSDADNVNGKTRYVVRPAELKAGPHTATGGVQCVSCHVPRAASAGKGDHHGPMGPARCGECHAAETEVKEGAHGGGRAGHAVRPGSGPPTCGTCHGPRHAIRRVADPASPVSPRRQPATCGGCHRGETMDNFLRSVHGTRLRQGRSDGPTCTTCHGSHATFAGLADITRNPGFKVKMVAVCGACHQKEAAEYRPSVHGTALLERREYASASCVDCHRSHQILPPADPRSSVHPTRVVRDCASCHANEKLIRRFHLPADVVQTYALSYHGKAGERGDARVANCSSCHEQHAIFPRSDPRSSIHPGNLRRSCGKCHPGASGALLSGKVHVRSSRQDNYWAWIVRTFYVWLIMLVVGGMVLHNALDYVRKMILRARRQRREPAVVRMTLQERVMHLILLLSFIALAYTGFALMYPKAWWVVLLNWISTTEGFRSTAHRVAGVVLSLVALQHLWFLFFHRRGREQRGALQPRLRDFRDLWHNLQFYVGRRKERPRFGRFGYLEKVEYWALVWGTAVMVLTGFVLWFEEWALRLMPLWLWEVFHVVHRFEAILAVLAIGVWHFYFVLINPDEAPMSLTWITGRMTHEELARLHPEELEGLAAPSDDAEPEALKAPTDDADR